MQSRCCTTDRNRKIGTHLFRTRLLKARTSRALRQKVGMQYMHNRINVGLFYILLTIR